MWSIVSVRLEIMLVSVAQKSFWTHPMELQGDMDNMESCFGPFGDNVSFGARLVHGLCQMYRRLKNHSGRARWYT